MPGRAAVRAAVTSYFQNAGISFVGTVFPARSYINETDYEQNMMGTVVASATGSACVLVVNILDDDRTRRADTGRGAQNDSEVHTVFLELFFANTGGDPIASQQDYDTIVDEIIQAIRNDPTLAAPTVIWSAGENPGLSGAPSAGIRHAQKEPYTSADGMTVCIPGIVQFEAWEWIAGPVTP
jgi:transcriptional regulator of met regulon